MTAVSFYNLFCGVSYLASQWIFSLWISSLMCDLLCTGLSIFPIDLSQSIFVFSIVEVEFADPFMTGEWNILDGFKFNVFRYKRCVLIWILMCCGYVYALQLLRGLMVYV